jgi:DUF177 domain-containing protein
MRSHRVDIGGLLGQSGQRMLVDDEVPLDSFEGVDFPDPARVRVELRHADRMLEIAGTIDVSAHAACAACLKDVERDLHVDVAERIDPSRRREDDPFGESNVLTGTRLDVADLTAQLVLSTLPMGFRCSDECRGLCGICGANRNAGDCSCDNGENSGKPKMENAAQ